MSAPVLRIEIGKRNFSGVFNLGSLKLSVKKYSFNVIGGPKMATIQVEGGRADLLGLFAYLRCPLMVYDATDPVWWGYVESVDVTIGAMQMGQTLKDMANKINVTYTLQSSNTNFDSAGTQQTTGYLADNTSVSDFGTFELRKRQGNLSACAASAYQQQELTARKRPMPTVDVNPSGAPDVQFAVITCKGWWESLEWRYYDNSTGAAGGMIINDTNADTPNERPNALGRGHTFFGNIWFDHLATTGHGEEMASRKNNLGLGYQEYFGVEDTNNNDRIYTVTGPSAPVGDYVSLSPNVTDEGSATARIATARVKIMGQKIAQSFQLDTNDPFFAKWVDVRLMSSGSVTDGVKATLLYDNSGSPTGASFNSGSVSGSTLSQSLAWKTINLDSESLLQYDGGLGGSIYWLELSRTGASDFATFYNVGLDIGKGYNSGSLLLYANSASGYSTRSACQGDADMLFRVTGVRQTTDQIVSAASRMAEFIGQTIVAASSNIRTSPYRDGETRLQSVVEDLLATGTANSKRLIATVDRHRNLIVDVEPPDNQYDYILASDGSIRDFNNQVIPPQRCPYGRWARAQDLGFTDFDTPTIFIEEVEYDAEKNRLSKIVTKNKKSVMAVTTLM